MTPAVASLLALLAVVVASLFSRLNVGVLAVALAWPIALHAAGWKADALIQTFPSSLFLTLLGVSMLFGVSQANGTMEALTHRAVRLCRGRAILLRRSSSCSRGPASCADTPHPDNHAALARSAQSSLMSCG